MLYIKDTKFNLIKDPLNAPFGFKGGYVKQIWTVVAKVENDDCFGVGLGVQSVLWSDARVFEANPPDVGNQYMYDITQYALSLLKGNTYKDPMDALDSIFDDVYEYGKKVTKRPDLRKTFALNALVPVDNALWQMYGRVNKTEDFLSLVSDEYKTPLLNKAEKLCNIPLVTYNMSIDDVLKLVNDGFFFLKVKIGCNPDGSGSYEKMVEWDKKRLYEIHNAVKDIRTEHTESGFIPYYFDANGRYDSKERLKEFIDYAEEIGALERIAIIEEPFPEEYRVDVSDLNVRLAADESAHSLEDAIERIELGYKAIALKPIAKTMSESIRILKEAHKRNIPCFCADLTVNPVMIEFNKNVAARIEKFPGIKVGIIEANGMQNYVHWDKMLTYHPMYGQANYIEPKNGIINLDEDFYKISGGMFRDSEYYSEFVR